MGRWVGDGKIRLDPTGIRVPETIWQSGGQTRAKRLARRKNKIGQRHSLNFKTRSPSSGTDSAALGPQWPRRNPLGEPGHLHQGGQRPSEAGRRRVPANGVQGTGLKCAGGEPARPSHPQPKPCTSQQLLYNLEGRTREKKNRNRTSASTHRPGYLEKHENHDMKP